MICCSILLSFKLHCFIFTLTLPKVSSISQTFLVVFFQKLSKEDKRVFSFSHQLNILKGFESQFKLSDGSKMGLWLDYFLHKAFIDHCPVSYHFLLIRSLSNLFLLPKSGIIWHVLPSPFMYILFGSFNFSL